MAVDYKRDFFRRFTSCIFWKKQKEVFNALFGNLSWFLFSMDSKSCFKLVEFNKNCEGKFTKKCLRFFLESKNLKNGNEAQQLHCCYKNKECMLFPIKRGSRTYGALGVCNVKLNTKKQILNLLPMYIDILVDDVQKELELTKLYDTIRPRAVALSTVHTLHRLISSTLDIEELLPRLARFSMQILHAKSCSIMLVDRTKKKLIRETCIGNCRKRIFPKSINIGKGMQGKVAKYATPILKKQIIVVPLLEEEVTGVITISDRINKGNFTNFDMEILTTFAEQAVTAITNARLYLNQEKIIQGAIRSLVKILESRLPYKYTHSTFYINSVLSIGKELGLSKEELRNLHHAALLPDVDRIALPERILKKKTVLTKREFEIVKKHPVILAKMISPLEVLRPTVPIILHHHERYDGTGYPSGLKGDKIPIGARIIAVADAFEAMIGKRPYRRTKTVKGALKEISRYSGTQFDPKVVSVFTSLFNGKLRLRKKDNEKRS